MDEQYPPDTRPTGRLVDVPAAGQPARPAAMNSSHHGGASGLRSTYGAVASPPGRRGRRPGRHLDDDAVIGVVADDLRREDEVGAAQQGGQRGGQRAGDVVVGTDPGEQGGGVVAAVRGLGQRQDLSTGGSGMSGIRVAEARTYAEGFSNTILEAMAAGLPVVSTDVVGVRDCVRPDDNGVLVPPQAHPDPVGAQQPDSVQQVEHAFAGVDPAVVEQHHRVTDPGDGRAVDGSEALGVGGAGHQGEPRRVDAVALRDLGAERRRADQQGGRVGEHRADQLAVRAAAGADPVPVAALHRHHGGQPGRPRGPQHGEPVGVGVLGVQDVERLLVVQFQHGARHLVDVVLEPRRAHLLPPCLQRHHLDTVGDPVRWGRPAAVHGAAGVVAAVLRHERHVAPGADEVTQQVLGAGTHARARRPPISVEIAGLRSLGRGVAYVLRSPQLDALRAALAARWRAWLTPQDAGRFAAHVTVQNTVSPAAARALLDELGAGFVPGTAHAEGLDLWRYAGGPWEFDGGHDLRPGPPH